MPKKKQDISNYPPEWLKKPGVCHCGSHINITGVCMEQGHKEKE